MTAKFHEKRYGGPLMLEYLGGEYEKVRYRGRRKESQIRFSEPCEPRIDLEPSDKKLKPLCFEDTLTWRDHTNPNLIRILVNVEAIVGFYWVRTHFPDGCFWRIVLSTKGVLSKGQFGQNFYNVQKRKFFRPQPVLIGCPYRYIVGTRIVDGWRGDPDVDLGQYTRYLMGVNTDATAFVKFRWFKLYAPEGARIRCTKAGYKARQIQVRSKGSLFFDKKFWIMKPIYVSEGWRRWRRSVIPRKLRAERIELIDIWPKEFRLEDLSVGKKSVNHVYKGLDYYWHRREKRLVPRKNKRVILFSDWKRSHLSLKKDEKWQSFVRRPKLDSSKILWSRLWYGRNNSKYSELDVKWKKVWKRSYWEKRFTIKEKEGFDEKIYRIRTGFFSSGMWTRRSFNFFGANTFYNKKYYYIYWGVKVKKANFRSTRIMEGYKSRLAVYWRGKVLEPEMPRFKRQLAVYWERRFTCSKGYMQNLVEFIGFMFNEYVLTKIGFYLFLKRLVKLRSLSKPKGVELLRTLRWKLHKEVANVHGYNVVDIDWLTYEHFRLVVSLEGRTMWVKFKKKKYFGIKPYIPEGGFYGGREDPSKLVGFGFNKTTMFPPFLTGQIYFKAYGLFVCNEMLFLYDMRPPRRSYLPYFTGYFFHVVKKKKELNNNPILYIQRPLYKKGGPYFIEFQGRPYFVRFRAGPWFENYKKDPWLGEHKRVHISREQFSVWVMRERNDFDKLWWWRLWVGLNNFPYKGFDFYFKLSWVRHFKGEPNPKNMW